MKKTIFLSAVMALATTGAFARQPHVAVFSQGQRGGGTVDERAKRQADKINATAQLSADQYTRVLAIAKDFANQREAAKNSGAQGDDLKAKFRALGRQEDAQLKTVLTPDQYAKVQAAKKEHHGG